MRQRRYYGEKMMADGDVAAYPPRSGQEQQWRDGADYNARPIGTMQMSDMVTDESGKLIREIPGPVTTTYGKPISPAEFGEGPGKGAPRTRVNYPAPMEQLAVRTTGVRTVPRPRQNPQTPVQQLQMDTRMVNPPPLEPGLSPDLEDRRFAPPLVPAPASAPEKPPQPYVPMMANGRRSR